MKVLVHGPSVAGRERLVAALCGLAARGHDVRWSADPHPRAEGVRGPAERRPHEAADLVVGAGHAAGPALLGRRARARGMVIALEAAALARWSVLDRLGWSALPALGLLEDAQSEAARAHLGHVDAERVLLWAGGPGPGAPDPAHADVELLERAGERALTGRGRRAAVFVDRDGTLIAERGYLADPSGVELLPGVAAALRLLHAARVPVVVISNQAGVGRGRYTLAQAHATMAAMRRVLRAEGVELDSVRFCPHAPDAGCACRKPGTLLLEEAAEDLGLALGASVMIGDKRIDAAAGRAAGGLGVLVRTGYGREEEGLAGDGTYPPPDAVVDDLAAAAAWVLERLDAH